MIIIIVRMMIPKCLLSLLTVVAATFQVAATDLFHLKDFTIQPGDTAVVEILLENEAEYTAFQTDLYLPEGLTIDRQSVTLTDRKASDHVIVTNVLVDGGMRFMSYSMGVNPYSGNNGALITFKVIASESLTVPANVIQKRTRFTKVSGEEITFDGSSCLVSCPGDVNTDGNTTIADVTALINYLLGGNDSVVSVGIADVNNDNNVSITDVTTLINLLLKG